MRLRDWIKRWLPRHDGPPSGGHGETGKGSSFAGAQPAAEPLYLEGAQHFAAGRLAEAEAALARALEHRHDHAAALLLQSAVYQKQGRLEDAADSLVLATHFEPDLAEAHFRLGVLAERQGRRSEAIAAYDHAIAADAGYAEAHNARGAARLEAGDLEEAVRDFRRAIELKPDLAAAHSNLGCVLITQADQFEDGAAHIETAWGLAPADRDVQVNWAMLLQLRGRLPESLALWNRLVENETNVDHAKLNRALVWLKQGEFALGWADYESRKRIAKEHAPRRFPFPEWNGQALTDRTVLVYAEQGLGDQIMFASCVPDLARLAKHCVVECAPKLKGLFTRSFPAATVVSAREPKELQQIPAIDYYVALGSLPMHFRNSLEQFPAHHGYLRADPERVAAWRRRLDALPGACKVGISWRGGMKSTRRSIRSLPLDDWGPILNAKDVDFVSLQYTDCQDELVRLAHQSGILVHHWQDAIEDYNETAALVCALDLVVSVQTAVVHLAGALGRPVWVMLPAVPEWRYLEVGGRMPWYPSMRLFCQAELGRWEPLTEQVARELAQLRRT